METGGRERGGDRGDWKVNARGLGERGKRTGKKVIGVDLKNEVGSPSQPYSHSRGRTKRERGGGRGSNIGLGGWEHTEGGRQGDSRER